MNKLLIVTLILFGLLSSVAYRGQNVGINTTNATPDASAMLDVSSTNTGLLIPRVSLTGTTDVTTITTAATSLLVYNTATASDVTPGYYYWNGTIWLRMINSGNTSGGDWALTGNAGTTVGTNFLGTTDAQDFAIYTNNAEAVRVTQNGNVGIGTTAPLANLHVVGSIFDVSSSGLQFGKIANGGLTLYRDVSGTFANDNGFIDFKYLASHQNDARIRYNNSLGTNGALEFLSNTDGISANSTSKMVIMNTGSVGIGTTAPSARLSVVHSSSLTADHVLDIKRIGTGAAGNGIFFTHGASLSDYNAITDAGDIGMFFDIDGNPAVSTSTNGLVIAPWANGGTPGLGTGIKIQENGNIGIGTTAPLARLDVFLPPANVPVFKAIKDFNGVANDYASFTGGIDVGFTNTGLYVLQKDNISFNSRTTLLLNAVINSLSQMAMNGYGNLRIGGDVYNTQCSGIATSEADNVKLAVWGGYTAIGSVNSDPGVGGAAPQTDWLTGVGSLVVGKNRSGGTANVDFWNNADPANGTAALSVAHRGFNWRNFQNTGGCAENLLMTLDGNGNLTLNRYNVGGGQVAAYAFNTLSDKRIKTKIETLSDDIVGKLMLLQPKSYNLIDVDYDPTIKLEFNSSKVLEKQYGFIAQEVYEVFPEFVHKPIDETKELWSVDYSKFVSVLVKTTQIQQKEIELLKKENENLTRDIKLIKEKLGL